ncbi:MAG: enoyl-CoA hydratase/isomerase family protein [Elusimicrobia bacterium]|nr:enoyl-CoA hydratase/isomerase family protein [Elusimicrobiota bacterium]
MEYQHLKVHAGPVTKVTLSRPELRNAMSDETLRSLTLVFREIASNPEVRAVIVTGGGKDFCAGADINWMKASGKLSTEEGKKDARLLADMLSAVDDCPVPVIVAAQGNCFGGGIGLLAACDIALVSEDAKMSFSECRLGIMPAVISSWVLPKIGIANARRYYLTAEVFGAKEAVAMGLAHEEVKPEELYLKADAAVANIMKCGPNAVRTAKALLPRLRPLGLNQQIGLTVDTLVRLRSSAEGQEGLAAFLEKRAPEWTR